MTKKRTKTRTKKKPAIAPTGVKRGRKPSAESIPDDWRAAGYMTIAEAAKAVGVAASTVYGWVKDGVLPEVPNDARKAVHRNRGSVWVLLDAVRVMRPPAPPAPAP